MSEENQNHKQKQKQKQQQMSALLSLFFTIILPTLILNKAPRYFHENGALYSLILALFFPLAYGVIDYLHSKNKSILAILGTVNTLFTGGLALFKFEGIYFAIKEASFPLLIGLVFAASAFTQKPLIHLMMYNDQLMNVDLIQEKLEEKKSQSSFFNLLKNCTLLLSLSFFFSAFLNYYLARQIFIEIPIHLSSSEQALILNEQIAQMTWKGYVVIALPSLFLTGGILVYLFKGIKKHTELELEQIMRT